MGLKICSFDMDVSLHAVPQRPIAKGAAAVFEHLLEMFAPRDLWLQVDGREVVVNWTRLAGRPPDLDDVYFVGTTWIREALVIPRHTMIHLVEQVGALEDAVAAHQLEPRISGCPEAGPMNQYPEAVDEAPGDHGENIAIFVRSLQTDRVEYFEVFESTGMSADAVTGEIARRTDELHERFGIDSHDVTWEGYSSLQALHRELGSMESLRALIRST